MRNMSKIALAALLCGVGGYYSADAYAQYQNYVAVVPTVGTTDLFNDVVGGVGTVPSKYATAAQIAGVPGYIKLVPSTGFTQAFGNSTMNLILNPAGTLATGTVTLSALPSDGQVNCVFSSQIITALTVSVVTGQTINNAVTALGAAGKACYTYSQSTGAWDRS
jgi:hypothetical protein